MKTLFDTWEKLFTAITFAEAGEFETARNIMRKRDQRRETIRRSERLCASGR